MKKKPMFIIIIIFLILLTVLLLKNVFNGKTYYNALPSTVGDVKLSSTKGDVNGDGKISSADYILVKKHILNNSSLTSTQKDQADVNGDGKISSADYIAVKKMILNGESSSQDEKNGMSQDGLVYKDSKAVVVDSKYSYTIANVNVLDYGADPNGVSDSTSAFKKAISAAESCLSSHACGGTVYVPKGKYLLTDTLSISTYISLIGDLEEGTTNGTVLMIKHGAGSTNYNKPAILVQVLGSVQNIAFWYPDQKVDSSGNVTKYPPTITFGASGTDGVTLENLYFVNSYIAMDFASSRENISIQFIRRIYGTPLHIGIINDTNYDTIKMENVNFSPKYWLNSGLSNIPSKANLNKALMNSSAMPSAIVLQRLDWCFLSNINIDGYFMGIKLQKSSRKGIDGGAEGELYDVKITDCYYPIYAYYAKHMVITNATLSATGGSGARAIHFSSECDFDYSILNSNISSTGDYAIYHAGKRAISILNSKVTGKIGKANSSSAISLVGDTLSNTGYDNCSIGTVADIKKKTYNKRVVTKPKSMNLIKISASENEDITDKIKDAISKLKSIGGIVYIPNGNYIVSSHIDVLSGIEIRGAVSWAHHRGYSGTTVLKTTYKNDSIFTLQSNSGINGLDIIQTDNWEGKSNNLVKYPKYVIKGNGSNIYIINVSLPAVWNGIDLTGCDNHYVEHIWGEFYNIGINVGGGSKNGIIRDSHFTISVLNNATQISKQTALTKQTVIKVGSSTGEIIFNTFTFGPGIGYHFDGATDFNAVSIGSDYSNVGIKLSSHATGQITNPLLVVKPAGIINAYANLSGIVNVKNFHYIESDSSYSGLVNIYNSLNWGTNDSTAFSFAGTGNLILNSGIVENSASPAVVTSNSAQSINGMIFGYPKNQTKFQINKGAWGFSAVGNIFIDGNSCASGIVNNAGIDVGIIEPKTNCSSSTPTTVSDEWGKTAFLNTSVTKSGATAKLCGLGSGILRYRSICNNRTENSEAYISNDCADIALKSCDNNNVSLSYQINNGSWQTVRDIGKYLIFAQVYNKLLYPGQVASNNSSNLGGWVNTCSKVSDCVKSMGSAAINGSNVNNETFVKNVYKGVIGREPDGTGLSSWVNALNSGTSRDQVINGVVNSDEAKNIYSAWGYY